MWNSNFSLNLFNPYRWTRCLINAKYLLKHDSESYPDIPRPWLTTSLCITVSKPLLTVISVSQIPLYHDSQTLHWEYPHTWIRTEMYYWIPRAVNLSSPPPKPTYISQISLHLKDITSGIWVETQQGPMLGSVMLTSSLIFWMMGQCVPSTSWETTQNWEQCQIN